MHDYRQQGALFSWIKKCQPEDRDWARTYLRGKGISLNNDAFEPLGIAPITINDARHREIDSQLRNAWRQRKARRKLVGRKAHNFVLSHSAKKKLDRIANEMSATIVDALNIVINDEDQRIEAHRQELKKLREEDIRLKRLSKSLQETSAVTKVLRATEDALHLQTMELALTQIRLENPLAQHAPQDSLKEGALEKFRSLWQGITASIGMLSLGLPLRTPDHEALWQKVMSESPDSSEETSSALP